MQTIQSYPPPTELPAMRAGEEPDGRYLDCTPALAPIGDTFTAVPTLTIYRIDGTETDMTDLASAGAAWPDVLDLTGRIPTYGLVAPASATARTYRLTISADTLTAQGRLFVRDWLISVLPWMG